MSQRCRVWALTMLWLAVGCASSKSSNTARTATEQLLISNAVDQALNQIDFRPFGGHAVYLGEKYVDCVDKSYVISSVRHRILMTGATLVDDPSKAEILVELRSGALGTDTSDSFVGIPEVTLPGMLTLPEVRILTRASQKGVAKLGLVAIDARTQQVLGSGGVSLAQSDTQQWFVMGVGPIRTGSIHAEVQQSTSGPAAQIRNRIPGVVAFNPPRRPVDADPDDRRYASTPDDETRPVNFEVPGAPAASAPSKRTPPRTLPAD